MDDPLIADFADGLDPINAVAEASPGFVWWLQGDSGNATDIRPFEDPNLLLNLTVWESVESLAEFTFRTDHRSFLRRRREWFEPADDPVAVLWWIPEGHRPGPADAEERLAQLAANGPTAEAFTFRHHFPPPT